MSGPKKSCAQLKAEKEAELQRQKELEKQKQLENSKRKIHSLNDFLENVNINFLSEWSGNQILKVKEKAKQLDKMLLSNNFEEISRLEQEIRNETQKLIETATENQSNEKRRLEIVNGILDSLDEMGFVTKASIENDKLGDVKILAEKPSGAKMDFLVNLKVDNIRMEVDDQKFGADCVEDLKKLIELLNSKEIDFEVINWGNSKPDSVKIANTGKPLPTTRSTAR